MKRTPDFDPLDQFTNRGPKVTADERSGWSRRKFLVAMLVMPALLQSCSSDHIGVAGLLGPDTPRETQPSQIGSNRQLAVRNELWYALDPNWLTITNDPNGPAGISAAGLSGASRWNYLSTRVDANANGLKGALRTYGGYVSNLIPGIGGTLTAAQVDSWASKLSADAYGLNYGTYKGVGHGTQCVAFAWQILYRALGGYQMPTWNWASMNPASYPSATAAQPGDIVFYKNTTSTGHVGICVKNDGSKITVVDSNFVGGDGGEVIARHDVSYASIGSKWKTYSGKGRWY